MVPLNLALYVVTGCWSQWKGCIAVLKSYRDIGLLIGMRLRGWGVLVTDWVTLANEKFYFWFIWLNQAVKGLELWVIFDHECNVGPISICLYVTSISNRQTDRQKIIEWDRANGLIIKCDIHCDGPIDKLNPLNFLELDYSKSNLHHNSSKHSPHIEYQIGWKSSWKD